MLGANGAGKSSLLRIMAGVDHDFIGEARPADGIRIGYLPQEPALDPAKDVRGNVDEAVASIRALLTEFDAVSMKFAEPMDDAAMNKLLEYQGDLQTKIDASGAWELDRKIDIAMDALRLPPGDADVTTLSGGEKRRVALCRVLLEQPDLLLLDEPTNHLDAESVAWLERHLAEFPGTVVAVTHDRYFLDNVAQWILELDRGAGIPWKGNYSSWLEQKKNRLATEEKQASSRQRTLERELEWIRMSPRARQAKSKARISAYEALVAEEREARDAGAEILIPAAPRLGDEVVIASGVSKGFGDRLLFENLNFSLPRGGIVGIIGPNGAGKTTLFRMITGEEQPDAGTLKLGGTVKISYVEQSREALNPANTVYQEMSGGEDTLDFGNRQVNARAYCASFGFRGADQQKKVGTLSGGERNRLNLAKLLRTGGNLLLLDEPTNDLDVDTLRALEDALLSFSGCVVVISHDRWFLDRIATHMLAFEGDSEVVWYEGHLLRLRGGLSQAEGRERGSAAPHPVQETGALTRDRSAARQDAAAAPGGRGPGHTRRQPVVELASPGPRPVPLGRRSALAPDPAQPDPVPAGGRSGAARAGRRRPRRSARSWTGSWRGWRASRATSTPGSDGTWPDLREQTRRLLLRRVRAAQLGADLLGRPGRPRRGSLQGRVRSRGPPGRHRSLLPEGLLRPEDPARRVAGGQRRGRGPAPDSGDADAGAGAEAVGRDREHVRPRGARAGLGASGWAGCRSTCSTPISRRTTPTIAPCSTSSTAAAKTCGCGRNGSSAPVACACCAHSGSSRWCGTPTKGMPPSCCWSGCASWWRPARRSMPPSKQVRATSVFTTHTPVPAGHDTFAEEQVAECMGPIWEDLGVSRERLMDLAVNPLHGTGRFHMTVLSIRLSRQVNGVSERHGAVSRTMWTSLWPDRPVDQVPIGAVTNGVHMATWMSNAVMHLLDRHLGADWWTRLDDPPVLDHITQLDAGGALGGARVPQGRAAPVHARGRAAPLRRRLEGGEPGRRRRGPARPGRVHHRVRPAVRDLQAGQPDLQRPGAAAPDAGGSASSGAARRGRQGPSCRHAGQGSPPERLPLHPRSLL